MTCHKYKEISWEKSCTLLLFFILLYVIKFYQIKIKNLWEPSCDYNLLYITIN